MTRSLAALLGLALLGVALLLAPARPAAQGAQATLLERTIMRLVPGLRLQGLTGFPTAPRFERASLADEEGEWLVVEGASLDVALLQLVRGRFVARRIEAERVLFPRLPVSVPSTDPTAPAAPGGLVPDLPDLPVEIIVEALVAPRVEIGEPVVGTAATLSVEAGGRLGTDGLWIGAMVRRLDAGGTLDLDLAVSRGQVLKVELDYDEPGGGLLATALGDPGLPAGLRVSMDGPASGAEITLDGRLGERARLTGAGRIALPATGGFGLDLTGEAALPGFLPGALASWRYEGRTAPAEGGATRIEALRAASEPLAFEASGLVGETLDLAYAARAGASAAFETFLPEGVGWDSAELTGRVSGPTASPRVTAQGVVRAPRIPGAGPGALGEAPDLVLDVQADRLHAFRLSSEVIRAEAAGAIGPAYDLAFSAEAGASEPFAALLPEGVGWEAIALSGTVRGPGEAPRLTAEGVVRAPRIPGAGPGVLGAAPSVVLDVQADRLHAFRLSSEVIRAEAAGAIGPAYDLAFSAEAGGSAPFAALLPEGAGWEAIALSGTVRGPGEAPRLTAEGVMRGPRLPGAPPEALGPSLDFALDVEAARLHALRIAAEALALEAAGPLGDDLDLEVTARAGDSAAFAALLPEGVGWDALELTGTARGEPASPRVAGRLVWRGPRLPGPLPGLLGEAPVLDLDAEPERIHDLVLEGRALTLRASGAIGETLDVLAEATLREEGPTDLPVRGRMDARAKLTGPRSDPAVSLTAESPRLEAYGRRLEDARLSAELPRATVPAGTLDLSARLQGLPLEATARAAAEGATITVETLRARLGPARLEGSGAVDTEALRADATLRLEAPDLAPLSPILGAPLAGGARLEARLDRRGERQGVEANLRLDGLRYDGTRADGTLRASGTDAALDLVADLRALDGRLTGRGRLALDRPDKRLALSALDVSRPPFGVRLTAPATVTYGVDGSISTPGLSLAARPGGTLRLSGRWGPETADLRATLAALPLSVVNLFAPDPPLSGTLSGEARVTGRVSAPDLDATLRGTGLRAEAPWARGVPPATLEATARARGGVVTARAGLRGGEALRLDLDARLPVSGEGPLSATLRGNADAAALAQPFLLGGANRVAGRVTLDARVEGTLAEPRLSGTARLANGSFRNLEYGATIRDVSAVVRGDGDRIVLESLSGRAGQGTVTARGEARPFAEGGLLDLTLTARDAAPVSSDLLRGAFDADLRLDGGLASGMRLAGRVSTRTLTIGIPEELPGSVPVLDDVRERGRGPPPPPGTADARRAAGEQRPPPRDDAPPLALDVAFDAPSRVYLRGRGLDAELGGAVRIGGTVSDLQARGALDLRRGTFTVLDRRLTFQRGQLRFDGDLLSPDLDLVTTSRAAATTVEVSVRGTPRAPVIEFSSVPELPQDEVLARLIFNRSADRLSPFQIAQLARVLAGTVSGGQEDPVTGLLGRVTRSLGLDRLGVGTAADGTPGIEAGGYLGQGIYLDVDPGTATGSPRVQVEIELAPGLKLQSGAGTDSQGIGLSYEIEY